LNWIERIIKAMLWVKNHPVPFWVGVAVVWLFVFDRDSVFYQFKLSREIKEYEMQNRELERKIDSTERVLKKMENKNFLERYAREVLLLRKKNEDIYLIDTTAYDIR